MPAEAPVMALPALLLTCAAVLADHRQCCARRAVRGAGAGQAGGAADQQPTGQDDVAARPVNNHCGHELRAQLRNSQQAEGHVPAQAGAR